MSVEHIDVDETMMRTKSSGSDHEDKGPEPSPNSDHTQLAAPFDLSQPPDAKLGPTYAPLGSLIRHEQSSKGAKPPDILTSAYANRAVGRPPSPGSTKLGQPISRTPLSPVQSPVSKSPSGSSDTSSKPDQENFSWASVVSDHFAPEVTAVPAVTKSVTKVITFGDRPAWTDFSSLAAALADAEATVPSEAVETGPSNRTLVFEHSTSEEQIVLPVGEKLVELKNEDEQKSNANNDQEGSEDAEKPVVPGTAGEPTIIEATEAVPGSGAKKRKRTRKRRNKKPGEGWNGGRNMRNRGPKIIKLDPAVEAFLVELYEYFGSIGAPSYLPYNVYVIMYSVREDVAFLDACRQFRGVKQLLMTRPALFECCFELFGRPGFRRPLRYFQPPIGMPDPATGMMLQTPMPMMPQMQMPCYYGPPMMTGYPHMLPQAPQPDFCYPGPMMVDPRSMYGPGMEQMQQGWYGPDGSYTTVTTMTQMMDGTMTVHQTPQLQIENSDSQAERNSGQACAEVPQGQQQGTAPQSQDGSPRLTAETLVVSHPKTYLVTEHGLQQQLA